MKNKKRKAVILAGGTGSRLFPLTKVTSKQLLPIGNKPLIYYPLSLPMLVGIKDVLIISQNEIIKQYINLFGHGEGIGINISYKIQEKPEGLAQGIELAKEFVGTDDFMFLLGDNIVHGHGLPEKINKSFDRDSSTMFGYFVNDPRSFGVINSNSKDEIEKFVEKPDNPESNWASIGVYVFKNNIFNYFKDLKKSERGEFELPDLVSLYMKENIAYIEKLGRGYAWFDAGTMENFQIANSYINIVEKATNKKIACLEEISYYQGWITKEDISSLSKNNKGEYYEYLGRIIND